MDERPFGNEINAGFDEDWAQRRRGVRRDAGLAVRQEKLKEAYTRQLGTSTTAAQP
jgi:hypothetical protein